MSEWEIPPCDTCCKRMTKQQGTSTVPHFIMNNRLVILYFVAIAFWSACLPFVLKNHCYLFHIAEPLDLLNRKFLLFIHDVRACVYTFVSVSVDFFFHYYYFRMVELVGIAVRLQWTHRPTAIGEALTLLFWCCHCFVTFVPLMRWQSFNILIVIWFLLWCGQ